MLVAVGGAFKALPVPVEEKANYLDAMDAYLQPERLKGRVAVIGGGLTGCELAIHLADQGAEVVLISRSEELLRKVQPRRPADGSADTHLIWLDVLKPEIHKGAACAAIRENGVLVKEKGEEVFIPADTVVNASGMCTDEKNVRRFDGCAPFVKAIGDCVEPALVGDAVLAAYEAVRALG